ncbi:uncharacterized protein LOC121943550 [Plectropomus leopardus]|uniref:uncharacterized protein LOC121943550 n=1 Tax=Plectropomus leopardus TaxID=160734 RepID=UPI001C4BB9DD|nr:uncharacterized protein LOC121943550 [Plectropomus leopardus]
MDKRPKKPSDVQFRKKGKEEEEKRSKDKRYAGRVTLIPPWFRPLFRAKQTGALCVHKVQVELRNKQTNEYCIQNYFRCSGNCGTQTTSSITTVSQNSYGYTWCHREVVWQGEIHGNQPFDIRYPTNFLWHNGEGYWASNTHSFRTGWSLGAHFDLGTRSDTGESNRSPTITSTPPLRITQNCPRRYSLPAFDHDGDAVRCRFGTSRESDVCGLCYQPEGFTLDQDSCTLSYTYTRSLGNSAFELIVEDFPRERITLSYSDGSYTLKRPSVGGRHRRDVTTDTTLSPFPFNSAPTSCNNYRCNNSNNQSCNNHNCNNQSCNNHNCNNQSCNNY